MTGCFASQSSLDITRVSCESCVVQYWGDQAPGSCEELKSRTCQGLDACACGTCHDVVDSYIQCLSHCTIDCSAAPTVSPAPTASPAPTVTAMPTRTNKCPEEYAAFNDCINPRRGGAKCESCLVQLWPESINSCSDVADPTCPGLANCPKCTGCESTWINYLICLTDGCDIPDCSGNSTGPSPAQVTSPTTSPAPTTHACPDERESVRACLKNSGLSADECSGCIQESFPATFSECGDIDDGICASLLTCPCGECDAQILSQINCAFEAEFEKPCQLTCFNGTSTTSIAPAGNRTSSGVPPTASPSPCLDEREMFEQCVASSSAVDARAAFSECESCVIDGYWPDRETLTHCSEIKSATCVGLSSCPSCVGCEKEFINYVRCYSGGCSLNCGLDNSNGTNSPVPDPGPTSTSGAAGRHLLTLGWWLPAPLSSTSPPVLSFVTLIGAWTVQLFI